MGIYDRDYYREEQRPGVSLRAPRTIVVTLILINVALWLIDGLLWPEQHSLTELLAVSNESFWPPWLWWKFLTYGFAHASSPQHILFNMLGLFFLGRTVEQVYGRGEFLRLYLVMLVAGSLVWAVSTAMFKPGQPIQLVGASGAVTGVIILFVLNFPHQTLILFPIPIPVKAWVIGVIVIVVNVLGSVSESGNTAFGVHLTGIAFAYLYFKNRWNLKWLGVGSAWLAWLKPRPRLRIHDPNKESEDLGKEVDRILEKIHRQGEESLTRKERRTLESASRKYQQRRKE